MSHRRRFTALLAALGVVLGAGGIFAAFTSTDNATQSISTGTVHIAITNDANTGHITDTWLNRAAGDTITRTFTVTNTSSLPLSELGLTITAPAGDDLIANPQGLRDEVWTCDQPYTTNSCGGAETVRQGYAAIAEENGTRFAIKDAGDLAPNTNVYVKAVVSLPYGAGNSLQDKSTAITYSVFALQRDGVDDPNIGVHGTPDAPNAADINVTTNVDGPVSVAFVAPAANGNAIDQYRITTHSTPTYVYGTSSPIEVTGLPVGAHNITLAAHNAQGWSNESSSVDFTVTGGNPALTLRASVSATGGDPAPDTYGDQSSEFPSVSADGRYVLFQSYGTDLVAGDTNNSSDVFVRDNVTGTNTLVSATPSGSVGNLDSYPSAISPNGRYALFYSDASDLVASPTPLFYGQANYYLRDLQTGTTTMVSLTDTGSVPDGQSAAAVGAVTNDGRYVLFVSNSTDVITGQTPDGSQHLYIRDTVANTTRLVDQTTTGGVDPSEGSGVGASMSPDGRYVAFDSNSDNLVAGDTNGTSDVFIRDMQANTTTRISVGPGNTQDDCGSFLPSMTDNAQTVVFISCADNWGINPQTFDEGWVWHSGGGNITPLLSASGTLPNEGVLLPAISGDGRIIIFGSDSTNVIPGIVPVDGPGYPVLYAQNTSNGDTEVISTDTTNVGYSSGAQWAISTSGRYVAFITADPLVASDHNNDNDVYLRDRGGR